MVRYVPLWEKIWLACCYFHQTILFPCATPGPIWMFMVTFRVASNDPSLLFTGLGQVSQFVQGFFFLLMWTCGTFTKLFD